MGELALVGLAGIFVGAGLGAAKNGAPVVLRRAFYVFSALCLVLAVIVAAHA